MSQLQREAIAFFKQKGFQRLFNLFIRKYQGLGRTGGSVTLNQLTKEEQEAFTTFFRKNYHQQKSAVISFAMFEKALAATKFSTMNIKDLLNTYAGNNLLTKAEEIQRYEASKENFFLELESKYSNIYCKSWIKHLKNKGVGSQGIHKAYNSHPEQLKLQLEHILKAISFLTEINQGNQRATRFIRLPIFANQMTSDPHGFDYNTDQGRFFLSAFQYILQRKEPAYSYKSKLNTEQISELLQYFGIVRDDILNFVTCAGLLGFTSKNKEPLSVWKSSWECKHVLNMPLREMAQLDQLMTGYAYENSAIENFAFVVENSGVFSAILDQFEGGKLPPMICTHGQFKLASLIALDLLVENQTTIYYSGDFDPEGLQMAQRIKQRYPNHVKLWHYQTEDYISALSNINLDLSRLNALQNITLDELLPVKNMMLEKKRVGYQEELVKDLVEDINNLLSVHNKES